MLSSIMPYRTNYQPCKRQAAHSGRNISFSGAVIPNTQLSNKNAIFKYITTFIEKLKQDSKCFDEGFETCFSAVENFINTILRKEGSPSIETISGAITTKNGKKLIKSGDKVKLLGPYHSQKEIAALNYDEAQKSFYLEITPKHCRITGVKSSEGSYIKITPTSPDGRIVYENNAQIHRVNT